MSYRATALLVSSLYALAGAAWILYSDRFVASLAEDGRQLTLYQNYKGWAYVLATAVLVYGLVRLVQAQHVRRLAALQRLSRVRTMLVNVNQAFLRTRDVTALLDTTCRLAVRDGGFRVCWIGHLDGPAGTLRILARASAPGQETAAPELVPGADGLHLPGGAIPYVCQDTEQDRCSAGWREGLLVEGCRSAAILPISSLGRVVGAVAFYAGERAVFDATELALLDELAMDVGFALGYAEQEARRDEAERALRESEARFRCLVEQSLAGCYIIQGQQFSYVNDAFAHMFGYDSPEEIVGRVPVPELVSLEDRARVADFVRQRLAGEARDVRYSFVGMRRDGGTLDVEVHGRAAKLDGKPSVIGLILDITERKAAEAQIHRLNADLERRVEERTLELRAANRELEAFTYAVSHDLRAPLRAMGGFSQALLEDHGAALQGEARLYLEHLVRGAAHMGELLDGLLQLSRSTRGTLRREAVDLSAMAQTLRAELAAAHPDHPVRCEIEPGLVARCDVSMAEIVLRNLLDNAWKYTVGTPSPRVRLFGLEEGGQRLFCITDNGAGFDMAHAAKLFEPFQRLHRQDEFPGVGVGLATVQRIVRRHGGDIRGSGVPGQGASFCFSLSAPGTVAEEAPR